MRDRGDVGGPRGEDEMRESCLRGVEGGGC